MIFTQKEYVLDQVVSLPAVYWKVTDDSRGKHYLAIQNDNVDPQTSANRLESVFDSTTGVVHVLLSQISWLERNAKNDQVSGVLKFSVRLGQDKPVNVPSGAGVPLTDYMTLVNQLTECKNEKFRLEMKLDRLQEKLEDDSGSTLERVLDPIAKSFEKNPQGTIQAIGSIFNPRQLPVINKPESNYSTWSDAEKITSVLTRLKNLDPEYVSLLEDLCTVCEMPGNLPYLKNMLAQALNKNVSN
jgi:hypothetical protein